MKKKIEHKVTTLYNAFEGLDSFYLLNIYIYIYTCMGSSDIQIYKYAVKNSEAIKFEMEKKKKVQ